MSTHLALVTDNGSPTIDHRASRRRYRPGLPVDPQNTWTRLVNTWADTLTEESPAYRETRLKHLGWLAGDHADSFLSPWRLSTSDLSAWLDQQRWSLSTRRGVVVSVRSFFAWGVRAGLCPSSPLSGVSVTPPRPPGPARMALPEAWDRPMSDYLTWLRAGARTSGTLTTRRNHLTSFAQVHAGPWTVTEGDLARWLSRGDWSPATKRGQRATLRSFYGWAERVGLVVDSPARDLDPVRQRRSLPRPTPADIAREALDAADDRVALALNLAMYAGLRRAEIAGLHTRDIGETSLRVLGKGGNERLVPMHPQLAALLREETERRRAGLDLGNGWGRQVPPADGWLFPSTDPSRHITPRWLGRLVSRTSADGWTAHTYRHRFATQAYAATRDLRAVQELLGHSKPETTARYAAVPDGALSAAVLGVGF
jgi:integrase/recombinase XerC